MSPDRNRGAEEPEGEDYEDEPPRSIFGARWFRIVVVVIVLVVVGAVAWPWVMDFVAPPAPPKPAVLTRPPAVPTPPRPALPPGPLEKTEPAPRIATAPPTAPMTPSAPPAARPAVPAAPAVEQKAATARPKAMEPSKAVVEKDAEARAQEAPKAPARRELTARRAPRVATAKATGAATGSYWVQVGAFKDEAAARRLAARLRELNFRVAESTREGGQSGVAGAAPSTAPPGGDRYEVFVTGASAADIGAKLSGKGLAAEASGNGVVITPSLPLRDAVALSKDLAGEGLKVQVKRAPAAGGAPTRAPVSAERASGEPLHRVRVGAFADRKAAQTALAELEAKGYKGFIARGRE